MTNILLIVLIAVIYSCNPKPPDKEARIEAKKKDTALKNSKLIVVDQHRDSSIIYDTIVFAENMDGKLLTDKFISSQPELKFYTKFISASKISEPIVLDEKDVKTEIKYLGQIKDLNNRSSYHVLTNFTIIGIGKMLSPRGKSYIAFVNEAKNKIIVYNLPMPDNLPKYIRDNVLFFEYDNTTIGISIFGGLPPLLCIPKIGCN